MNACSFVEFESSPYAPRELEIIYSEQEDITFFFWKLDESADLDLVSFELFDPTLNQWVSLDLTKTIYPQTPYSCGRTQCFQFQLRGMHSWAMGQSAIRSFHQQEGYYGPLDQRERTSAITFGVNPIAIKQNVQFDPRRFDWFDTQGISLKREYEWRLLTSTVSDPNELTIENCTNNPVTEWAPLKDPILKNYISDFNWEDDAYCMEARPIASIPIAVRDIKPFPPSARLTHRRQTYIPPHFTPPTLFFSLADLFIRSHSRCEAILQATVSVFRDGFKGRTPSEFQIDVGDFTPFSQGLDPLSGCDQVANRRYPITELQSIIKQRLLENSPEDVMLIGVYLNNLSSSLETELIMELEQLSFELNRESQVKTHFLAIGDDLSSDFIFNDYIPWRSLESDSFEDEMRALARSIFPIKTMDFISGITPIQLKAPETINAPQLFKICSLTPDSFIQVKTFDPSNVHTIEGSPFPWGNSEDPQLFIDLPSQDRVFDTAYQDVKVVVDYEVCTRFCALPFRANSGVDFAQWDTAEQCQYIP